PEIILLDEPLTSLDVVVALEVKRLLREIRSSHIIIFSTHILQLAKDLCDEIVVLHKGKLELIDKDLLGDPDFEDRIMDILKVDEND
ncbi:MAG: ABC transporter ATP-binding protein, partial [Clostridium sp.]|nr:ABC transporter ATP-binding protein [Clostridium sp.]